MNAYSTQHDVSTTQMTGFPRLSELIARSTPDYDYNGALQSDDDVLDYVFLPQALKAVRCG